ncbi:MAG TPA: poly-beta-1,6-N-acetyl-D-glucosamine biosynthesis protein PgaD [Clostridia bacterium]|nr:poly-beta-1,6-N-acetyl-D-glucosamine biosynthesis protein PgaD [Clostridia bacterium]
MSNFIIDGRQKKPFKWVEVLLTFAGWSYLIFFLINIFLTVSLWFFNISRFYSLFGANSMKTTLKVIIATVSTAVIVFLTLLGWRRYNLKKFGGLRRRKFPADFDAKAAAEYFSLPVEDVVRYQSSRLIVLEKTIV